VRPLKLVFPGEYWDSQIYAGRLYLFSRKGSILTVDWDSLISGWPVHRDARLALEVAFRQSDYLYNARFRLLLQDRQVKDLLRRKFDLLASQRLEVSSRRLKSALVSEQPNPFPFPHADSAIYNQRLYVGASSGVFDAGCNKKTKYGVAMRAARRFDAPAFAIAPSYGTVAVAAGQDGLFSVPVFADIALGGFEEPLLTQHCSSCAWAYYSIYGSSHIAGGKLAAFRKELATWDEDRAIGFLESTEEADPSAPPPEGRLVQPAPWDRAQWGTVVGRPPRFRREPRVVRTFEGAIAESEIFGNGVGYSWASQDKICLALDGRVSVVRYRPWEKEPALRLQPLGSINLRAWKGGVVSGGVALFGTVIECENAIVVITSDESTTTIAGEPVNWRVFTRSKHYENQLHVIFDDRLEMYSFNHDYFVDQDSKRSGTTAWIR
jgi:hypothetical protein